jgi:subtilisin-like proprotein convertase family protein
MKRLALTAVLAWLAAAATAHAQHPITIPSAGPASPYPSVIDITDSSRIIEDVDVLLNDLAHDLPNELDVALVGPDGTTVMLMSDVGVAPATACLPDLQFSSEATGPVPDDPLLCGGVYQPTDDDSDDLDLDVFPDPGPAGTPGSSLTPFNGQNAAGTWRLYVVDDTSDDGGSIVDWRVVFNTRLLGQTRQASPPTNTRSEHDGVIQFAIHRTGGSATAPLQAATVDWAAQECQPQPLVPAPPPSATAGSDYVPVSGTVALGPGQADAVGEVGIVNDEVPESSECVGIRLTGVTGDARLTNVTEGLSLIRNFSITDDDPRASAPKVTAAPGQRVLRRRGVVVTALSRVTGTVGATGTIAVPRSASAVVRLKPAKASVAAGGTATLRLRLSKKALKAVRRGFTKRRALMATIRVTEIDLAGGRATTVKSLKLRR